MELLLWKWILSLDLLKFQKVRLKILNPVRLFSLFFHLVLIQYRKFKKQQKKENLNKEKPGIILHWDKDNQKLLLEEYLKETKRDIGSCYKISNLCLVGLMNQKKFQIHSHKIVELEILISDCSYQLNHLEMFLLVFQIDLLKYDLFYYFMFLNKYKI